jgi:benzil reductase ((S)-benzoin forming)
MKNIVLVTGISRGLGRALFDAIYSRYQEVCIIGVGRSFTNEQKKLASTEPLRVKLISVNFNEKFNIPNLSDLYDFRVNNVYVILNAGIISPIGLTGDINYCDFESCIYVNFLSQVKFCQYLLDCEKNKKISSLSIINISTGAAYNAIAGWSSYCSSKAAIRMYLDCMQKEYSFISVKHFDPGVLDTDMQKEIRSKNFPCKEKFVRLKKENKLKDPYEASLEILQQVFNT